MANSNEILIDRKIELKKSVFKTGIQVIEMMEIAMDSLFKKDEIKHQIVVKRYSNIFKQQYVIEEKVAKLISECDLDSKELRDVISSIRIIVHLERIAARCKHMSGINICLPEKEVEEDFKKIRKIMNNCVSLFLSVMESYYEEDINKTKKIPFRDLEIQSMYKRFNIRISSKIKKNPELTDEYIKMINLNRDMERLASHIINISIWIYYIITGEHVEIKDDGRNED